MRDAHASQWILTRQSFIVSELHMSQARTEMGFQDPGDPWILKLQLSPSVDRSIFEEQKSGNTDKNTNQGLGEENCPGKSWARSSELRDALADKRI